MNIGKISKRVTQNNQNKVGLDEARILGTESSRYRDRIIYA
jgi:hypothetical protein